MKNITPTPPLRRAAQARRKAIDLSVQQVVATRLFNPGQPLPLVFEPAIKDVELPLWIADHLDLIDDALRRHGAVLFRGFGLKTQADFESALGAARIPLMNYMESATPRLRLGENIYTSTEFPAACPIALHNELSYVKTWPLKICFFCAEAPKEGGETPLADVRNVYERLDLAMRVKFEKKGWRLVRNYGTGLGLTWQESFHTQDISKVEAYCREGDVDFEWYGDDNLRTFQTRPAVARHPRTGETVWFNHLAFWHIRALSMKSEKDFLRSLVTGSIPSIPTMEMERPSKIQSLPPCGAPTWKRPSASHGSKETCS